MTKLPGDGYTYNFIDNIDINKDGADHIPQEFLQSQTPSELPSFRLNLKVGALIILLCNLYPMSKECNRTRIVITRLAQSCIEACILGGKFNGQLCLIFKIMLIFIETKLLYVLSYRQYLIRLCFTMTVNKL